MFAKVGDSNTATQAFLRRLGCPGGARRVPGGLRATLSFFAARPLPVGYTPFVFAAPLACPSNSFVRIGYSAHPGWGVAQLLLPFPTYRVRLWHRHLYAPTARIPGSRLVRLESTPHGACPPETRANVPCELAAIHPGVALVMIGTNDLGTRTRSAFARDLTRVVGDIEAAGTIPVLSTIPPRWGPPGADVAGLNHLVSALARASRLPLWDFWRALQQPGVRDQGLDPDGTHLSIAPSGADDLEGGALAYGMNLRNLQALQVLDLLRRKLLAPTG